MKDVPPYIRRAAKDITVQQMAETFETLVQNFTREECEQCIQRILGRLERIANKHPARGKGAGA